MFELTLADAGCAEYLARLQAETFVDAYRDLHAPADLQAYCRRHYTPAAARALVSAPATVCCLATAGEAPAGYYIVRHHNCPLEPDEPAAELKQIYIRAAWYGRGLGRRLFDHALAGIGAAGRHRVWLTVADSNRRARAFYARAGFEPIGIGPVLEVGRERLNSTLLSRGL